MKRYLVLIIAGLLLWNIILSYNLYDIKNKTAKLFNENNPTIPQQETKIESDFTKVYKKNASSIVGVSGISITEVPKIGTGFIYQTSVEGYEAVIITSYSLVKESEEIQITFASGTTTFAQLVGFDSVTDVAVLSVNVDYDLTGVKFGDSSRISMAESIILCHGYNNSLNNTYGKLSSGIIVGKDLRISVSGSEEKYALWDLQIIQSDNKYATLGSPIINVAGETIGMVTVLGNDNISSLTTILPINEITPVVKEIIEEQLVTRSPLGLLKLRSVSDMALFDKDQLKINIDIEKGLYITTIALGSVSEEAGLRSGDIIISIDGEEVNSYRQYTSVLYSKNKGDTVQISYIRNDESHTVTLTIK